MYRTKVLNYQLTKIMIIISFKIIILKVKKISYMINYENEKLFYSAM